MGSASCSQLCLNCYNLLPLCLLPAKARIVKPLGKHVRNISIFYCRVTNHPKIYKHKVSILKAWHLWAVIWAGEVAVLCSILSDVLDRKSWEQKYFATQYWDHLKVSLTHTYQERDSSCQLGPCLGFWSTHSGSLCGLSMWASLDFLTTWWLDVRGPNNKCRQKNEMEVGGNFMLWSQKLHSIVLFYSTGWGTEHRSSQTEGKGHGPHHPINKSVQDERVCIGKI